MSELETVRICFLRNILKKLEIVRISNFWFKTLMFLHVQFVGVELFITGIKMLEKKESEIVRIEICQNGKLPELEIVKMGNCQNWNLSEWEMARIGNCQNWKSSELEIVRI